jgi:predicted Fe-S protein YdhL (DUF1289 family)
MATSSIDADGWAPVESPCIRLCTLDDDDICVGCHRSVAEVCAWGGASDDERRQILAAVSERHNLRQRHV